MFLNKQIKKLTLTNHKSIMYTYDRIHNAKHAAIPGGYQNGGFDRQFSAYAACGQLSAHRADERNEYL